MEKVRRVGAVAASCAALLSGITIAAPTPAFASSDCWLVPSSTDYRSITSDYYGTCLAVGASHWFQPTGTTSQFQTAWSWSTHWVEDTSAYKLVSALHDGY